MFKVSYIETTGPVVHGRGLAGRQRRQWVIKGSYDTPQGPQEFIIKPKKSCFLLELADLIEAEMNRDREITGGISNIKWTAVGR